MFSKKMQGHTAMIGAEVLWGVSAPIGKMILLGGVSPMLLTDCRMAGAAVLFWVLSLFTAREPVARRDLLLMFAASLFGIVINQCCFLWGLSLTSPVNASIITTSMPIITMVLAAVVLREPITLMKAGGVALGAGGAVILILGNGGGPGGGSAAGDLLIILAQCSFACYLVLFKKVIGRYSAVTMMKWMFTFASIAVLPFSYDEWMYADWGAMSQSVLWGVVFFVVGPTFVSYLLLPLGQRVLRPTVTAMYNYVQPVVACLVAVWAGIAGFTVMSGAAVALVFTGVWLVTRSKSRADIESGR